jgi:meiotically up-regulated gene 157 (Mug157) protein
MGRIQLILTFVLSLLHIGSATAQSAPSVKLQNLASSYAAKENSELKEIFLNGLQNVDSQFRLMPDGTEYVSTGDIGAEWLRDSSVEARPYLFFVKNNPSVAAFLKAVVMRQAKYILQDPYANAFTIDYGIHEEKFELDSLANPILLAWTYWKVSGDSSIFTSDVAKAFEVAVDTMITEQDHTLKSHYTHEGVSRNPVGRTGMIWTGFRPSDDSCKYGYLIPAEAMAVQALQAIAEISSRVLKDSELERKSLTLKSQVWAGIQKYGIVKNKSGEDVLAYEVDGLGHQLMMDDANLPNLTSLTYYGAFESDDPVYVQTRKQSLSFENPYFFSGDVASGLGSSHTGDDMIWPLGLLSRGFTAQSPHELIDVLRMLINSDSGDHLLHESFNQEDPNEFTRANFGWPNALFIELWLTKSEGFAPLPTLAKP